MKEIDFSYHKLKHMANWHSETQLVNSLSHVLTSDGHSSQLRRRLITAVQSTSHRAVMLTIV